MRTFKICLSSLPVITCFAVAACGKGAGSSLTVYQKPTPIPSSMSSCLDPGEVLKGKEYQCANGVQKIGTLEVLQVQADPNLLPENIKSGVVISGVTGSLILPLAANVRAASTFGAAGGTSGTLADCSVDGAVGCVSTTSFKAADMTVLVPTNLKSGVTIAGQTGNYPSVINPLVGSNGSDLPSLDASVTAGSYQFFKSDGTRHTGSIADASTITPSTATQNFATSLYRAFTVAGDADLVPSKILSGTNVFGVLGTSVVAPADCAADGALGCVSVAPFAAAETAGLSSKVLSGQTVAGVVGNVTMPSAANVRSSATFGISGGTSGTLADCSSDGSAGCVTVAAYASAATAGLASKVLSGQTVAGVAGNVTLPAIADVRAATTYGISGTGLTGSMAGATADCTADGQSNCKIPSSGTIKAAETANFTGWDIRKKRSGITPFAPLTFAGLTSQAKSHCRNRANFSVWNYNISPGLPGLDFFDTIDDFNNNIIGLPGTIPAWTMLIGGSTVTVTNDFKCGGIYATGNTNTGNTGSDATVAHDPDGNWQDLTPGILPGGANSSNTADGCNAIDKHCVFKELISGLMVTEVGPGDYPWSNAISFCDNLGGGPNPIPIVGGLTYSDWRLPTQKELIHISAAGVIGLNQTATMKANFGNLTVFGNYFWSSSSASENTISAKAMILHNANSISADKVNTLKVLCVR
jgi:hypothetical protein